MFYFTDLFSLSIFNCVHYTSIKMHSNAFYTEESQGTKEYLLSLEDRRSAEDSAKYAYSIWFMHKVIRYYCRLLYNSQIFHHKTIIFTFHWPKSWGQLFSSLWCRKETFQLNNNLEHQCIYCVDHLIQDIWQYIKIYFIYSDMECHTSSSVPL